MVDLPWNKETTDKLNIAQARYEIRLMLLFALYLDVPILKKIDTWFGLKSKRTYRM